MSQIRISTTPNFIGWDAERAEHWTDDALCKDVGTDQFYPDTVAGMNEARQVCLTCPVRLQCLEQALESDEWGIWGGSTEGERKAIRKGSITLEQFLAPRAPVAERDMKLGGIFEGCGHRRTINNVVRNGSAAERCRTCRTERLRGQRRAAGIRPKAESREQLFASIQVDIAAGLTVEQIVAKNHTERARLRKRLLANGRDDLAAYFSKRQGPCGHSDEFRVKNGHEKSGVQKYICSVCRDANRRVPEESAVA